MMLHPTFQNAVLFILCVGHLVMSEQTNRRHKNKFLRRRRHKTRHRGRKLWWTPQAGNTLSDLAEHHLANLDDVNLKTDTPWFFHIPKASGSSMKHISSTCLNLVVSMQVGIKGHENDRHPKIVDIGGRRYVNVDTTSEAGIIHSKKIGFEKSGLADIVVSSLFPNAVENLFDDNHRGVMFTIFRHPVHRVNSLFHYLGEAYWEKTYDPSLKSMTVEQYEASGKMQDNWMVRTLAGKVDGSALTFEDLEWAKYIVRTKCLVGLSDDMETSLNRFGQFFHWNGMNNFSCLEQRLRDPTNTHPHPRVQAGSKEWEIFKRHNELDIALYHYAVSVFHEQGEKYFSGKAIN